MGEAGEFGGAPALLAGRCGPDAGPCFEGPGTGVVWGAGLQEIAAWGQPVGAIPGWDGRRLPRAGRVGVVGRPRSLTVREVSFGGVWPSSRVRYDEGGHSGRFRLGGLGLVQSRHEVSALPRHEGCYEGDDEGSNGDHAGCRRCCCSDCRPPREAVLSEWPALRFGLRSFGIGELCPGVAILSFALLDCPVRAAEDVVAEGVTEDF